MKPRRLTALLCFLAAYLLTTISPAEDLIAMPPVVVKTVPEAGTLEVAPGEVEIKVIFSKEMTDQSWSLVDAWKDSTPQVLEKPKYGPDHKTWTMKVKLEAGKTYAYWLNSQKFMNFKDAQGRPAVPYLLAFKTKDR